MLVSGSVRVQASVRVLHSFTMLGNIRARECYSAREC